jgi:hypothetical protein
MQDKRDKWYFRESVLIIAFLSVGPFALPLVWFNPRYGIKAKIVISAVIIILSFILGAMFITSLRSIITYYKAVFYGQGIPGL